MALHRVEIGEGHLERATDLGIQVMNLAGEAMRRQPFGHGIRIEKRTINPLRLGAEHTVKPNGVSFVFAHNDVVLLSFSITTKDIVASGHILKIYFARQFSCARGAVMLYSKPWQFAHNLIMNLQLENKMALVTGSTKGIGFAIAKLLAAEGAKVIVNGRSPESAQAAARKIGPKAQGVAADVSTATGCAALLQQVPTVDILVNNAGIFEPKPFAEIPDADWERFYQVNVMSGVRLTRAYLPGMLQRNQGRVIFMSSESGVQIPEEMIHYGMTKAAELALVNGIAQLTRSTGVTVNAVLPGPTASEGVTDFVDKLAAGAKQTAAEFEKEFFRNVRPTSLLQRFASVDEVASLVAYLCSPLASATNGAAVRVDGGVLRGTV
jgi:NAD(P)-dependent dehydrogenase (short-subunit alcohol dehydrogenase family)